MMEADRPAVLGRHGQYDAAAGDKARVGREGLLRLNHIDQLVVSGGALAAIRFSDHHQSVLLA
jgi:hypothetical protein